MDGLIKVADLLEYDGPILSHFKDSHGLNYLFHWVDYDANVNRWLVWKITDLQLYRYLKGLDSLHDLQFEENKDWFYSVEIDRMLEYRNILMFPFSDIPETYLVEEDSLFTMVIPDEYSVFLEEFEPDSYLGNMRANALTFKIKSRSRTFGNTISADGAARFLQKLNTSIYHFIKEDYFQLFKNSMTSFSTEQLSKVIKTLSPRIVDVKFSSFEVGLSTDMTKSIGNEDVEVREWRRKVLQKYSKEIVELDYQSQETLDMINETYREDFRREVFKPFIEIVNSKEFQLEAANPLRSFKKRMPKIAKANVKKIIPSKKDKEEVIESDGKKLIAVILEVGKGDDAQDLTKKDIKDSFLFQTEMESVQFPIHEITISGKVIKLTSPIVFEYRVFKDSSSLTSEEFEIEVTSSSKDEVILKCQFELGEIYRREKERADAKKENYHSLFDKYL